MHQCTSGDKERITLPPEKKVPDTIPGIGKGLYLLTHRGYSKYQKKLSHLKIIINYMHMELLLFYRRGWR